MSALSEERIMCSFTFIFHSIRVRHALLEVLLSEINIPEIFVTLSNCCEKINAISFTMPYLTHDSDFEFVRLMKADDMRGFDMLYRKYSERIYHFAFGILKSAMDAEEIVQDVFFKVWEKRDTIREDDTFSSFIFTITYHASISCIRKRVRETKFYDYLKSIQHFEVQENISADVEFAELKEKAQRFIDQLPRRQKEIYLLSREDGLTYKEIAKKLQISVNTVENHMVKALRFLREHLGKISAVSVFLGLFLIL